MLDTRQLVDQIETDIELSLDLMLTTKTETQFAHDWMWQLYHAMLAQTKDHVLGCTQLLQSELPTSAEGVARMAIESAIDLLYILQSDSEMRMVCYLASFVEGERRNVEKWQASARTHHNGETLDIHLRHSIQRESRLVPYDLLARAIAQQLGIPYPAKAAWPNTRDRYFALGEDTAYRTEYASLSNSVHNRAEEVLVRIIPQSMIHLEHPEWNDPQNPEGFLQISQASILHSAQRSIVAASLRYFEAAAVIAKRSALIRAHKDINVMRLALMATYKMGQDGRTSV